MARGNDQTIAAFHDAVNMTAKGLEGWLDTDEAKAVGQKDGGDESVGHESGRRIIALLDKHRADYTDVDIAHMRKVVGYVHRHLAHARPATSPHPVELVLRRQGCEPCPLRR